MVRSYRSRLARLAPSGYLLPEVDERLCLLTGQSDFRTSQLHNDKLSFLHAVAPSGVEITELGFPWHRELSGPRRTEVGLFAASIRNAWQFFLMRYDSVFQDAIIGALDVLFERTSRRLLLVTGSCGVGMLSAALARMPAPEVEVQAAIIGPVGTAPVTGSLAKTFVVQGLGDAWSRLGWRHPVHYRPDCGHMEYWMNTGVIEACRSFFQEGM